MSRFNQNTIQSQKTVNLAGGEAFKESPKLELVSLLLTSFVKDQYYRSSRQGLQTLEELVINNDIKFVAKAGIFARTEFGMRSISHALAGEVAYDTRAKVKEWAKRFFNKIVYRPDDMAEILSYYLSKYGKPIPNAMKKGFAKAITKFDAYQLAKYRNEGKKVSLVDIFNLVHPKPKNEEQGKVFYSLIRGNLVTTQTWESKLTKAGQVAETKEEKTELKKQAWVELVKNKKIGYFALLRNLRNIIQQAPEVLDDALLMLTDRKFIKKSLVLPFRFVRAYIEIVKMGNYPRKVIDSLNEAVELSLANCPSMQDSLVAVDASGSMLGLYDGEFGNDNPLTTASLFAAIMASKGADVVVYSGMAYHVKGIISGTPIITLAEKIFNSIEHAATNLNAVFEILNRPYRRIIILSDEQTWVRRYAPTKELRNYRKIFNVDPHIYDIDLAGYGTLQFPERRVYSLAGFSEKIFDIMEALEQDREALIHKIEAIEI